MPIIEHMYYVGDLDTPKKGYGAKHPANTSANRANLVSSRLAHSYDHVPVLDIDFPARLIPSSTPGHFHLFLYKPMPWADYVRLLDLMVELGLLEENWVTSAKKDGMTLVRKPGVFKPQTETNQQLRQQNAILREDVQRLTDELAKTKQELQRAALTNWT